VLPLNPEADAGPATLLVRPDRRRADDPIAWWADLDAANGWTFTSGPTATPVDAIAECAAALRRWLTERRRQVKQL
jgi:hypothetical protein